jgi:hypothetical protein
MSYGKFAQEGGPAHPRHGSLNNRENHGQVNGKFARLIAQLWREVMIERQREGIAES